MEQVSSIVSDDSKQRDLILEDEEEDFLDDGNRSRGYRELLRKWSSDRLGDINIFHNLQLA